MTGSDAFIDVQSPSPYADRSVGPRHSMNMSTHNSKEREASPTRHTGTSKRKLAQRWCHQCRAKKDGALCCNERAQEKRASFGLRKCKKSFCAGCLSRYYSEALSLVMKDKHWLCPYCRGDCLCSHCIRERDQQQDQGHPMASSRSVVSCEPGLYSLYAQQESERLGLTLTPSNLTRQTSYTNSSQSSSERDMQLSQPQSYSSLPVSPWNEVTLRIPPSSYSSPMPPDYMFLLQSMCAQQSMWVSSPDNLGSPQGSRNRPLEFRNIVPNITPATGGCFAITDQLRRRSTSMMQPSQTTTRIPSPQTFPLTSSPNNRRIAISNLLN